MISPHELPTLRPPGTRDKALACASRSLVSSSLTVVSQTAAGSMDYDLAAQIARSAAALDCAVDALIRLQELPGQNLSVQRRSTPPQLFIDALCALHPPHVFFAATPSGGKSLWVDRALLLLSLNAVVTAGGGAGAHVTLGLRDRPAERMDLIDLDFLGAEPGASDGLGFVDQVARLHDGSAVLNPTGPASWKLTIALAAEAL